jgi:hypothetical protein
MENHKDRDRFDVFVQIVDFMYIENRRLNLFLLLCLFDNND